MLTRYSTSKLFKQFPCVNASYIRTHTCGSKSGKHTPISSPLKSPVAVPPLSSTASNRIDPIAELTGVKLVHQRCANILLNITDTMMNKVLYLHCDDGNGLIGALGQSKKFDIEGITDDAMIADECKKMKQYSKVELINFNEVKELPCRPRAYQLIASLLPIDIDCNSNRKTVDITEIERLLAEGGFALIGAPDDVYMRDDYTNQIKNTSRLQQLSLQTIPCADVSDDKRYCLTLVRLK